MPYQNLAPLYDQMMKHAPYDKWYKFTKGIINNYQVNVSRIADLGCGTGEITIQLGKDNYEMYGIDFSAEMLAHASEKAFQKGLNINWIKQDLRDLKGLEKIDLAISYCDVINYITKRSDIKKVFKNVYEILKEDGLFIFDVHSVYHVENNLLNKTFADVKDDYSYIWFCYEGEEEGEMQHDLTFFQRKANKYIRFQELHQQKTYPSQLYKELLAASGFTNIKMYSDFNLENDQFTSKGERIFFSAQKSV